ncbi:MAG: hypothetical protein Q4E17_06550 [Synergistes sp.]|nr:hypothetical protein [Synergistes sp.]
MKNEPNNETIQNEAKTINATKPKHAAKDSIFHDLFSLPEYLFQLYRVLHPEDKETTEADLSIITLKKILVTGEYNDLGFMAKDKLIILVEAQSTWSVNIVVRALMYLMNSYQEYFNSHGITMYSGKKIKMPKPELYVIYTKEREGHPDIISLKEEYFPNEECCIDAKVKIIYEDESNSITNQYICFCKVFDDCVKKYGRTQEAMKETFRICADRDLLKEYLKTRETEVKGIMLTLFDQERVTELYGLEMREEGIGIGRANTYLSLVRRNLIPKSIAAEEMGISMAQLEKQLGTV